MTSGKQNKLMQCVIKIILSTNGTTIFLELYTKTTHMQTITIVELCSQHKQF